MATRFRSPTAALPVADGGHDLYDSIADYYDLIYAAKDYETECQFLRRVFRQYRPSVRSILDLGCGTGGHAGVLAGRDRGELSAGFRVTGVDRSAAMLERARSKFPHLDFRLGDLLTYRSGDRYDAVIAMFGVLGHVHGQDLHRAFHTANYHLKPGGLFIFDGWHRPAVMRGQRPRGKLDQYGKPSTCPRQLFKYVEMYYVPAEDVAHVEYVIIDLDSMKAIQHYHNVSLLTSKTVEAFCGMTGFAFLSYCRQFTLNTRPRANDWKVSVVVQKFASGQSPCIAVTHGASLREPGGLK